jgi:hypothetical protein
MGVAEEHRYHLATEIRQPAFLAVEIRKLEVLPKVGAGDVRGAEGRSLGALIARSQREEKRKSERQPPVPGKYEAGQTRMRQ